MDHQHHHHQQQQQQSSSSSGAAPDSRDQYLKGLNKLSHKISKPTPTITSISKLTSNPPPLPLPPPPPPQQLPQQQSQPPVYNINKNDFRDVVQKLTGSPAHDRSSPAPPPPIHPPKPQSSRLQRIRPPPLAHLTNRPPPPPPLPNNPSSSFVLRPPSAAPLSPLPPFPAVHAAAESPVSAYMRYLHNSMPNVAPLVSPRWNSNLLPPPPQGGGGGNGGGGSGGGVLPSPSSQQQFQLPLSPLPFGCLNSPNLLLSSSPSSFPPLSPTVPSVSSPKWKRV
ncbi:VQ motif-containing protein 9 [Linum perenne]